MKKIAITGVHSAGKTSLAYILAAHFKVKKFNVKLIHESVRECCPFPINADANQGTCLWNFHKQFLNELETEAQGYELAICDRSVIDTFVYYHAVNEETSITRTGLQQAAESLATYNVLVCLEPNPNISLDDDGVRSTDIDYQKKIQEGFRDIINRCGTHVQHKIITATSDDVFDPVRRDKLIEEVEKYMDIPAMALVE